MGAFYSIALVTKGLKDKVTTIASTIEQELKTTYKPNAWFNLKLLDEGTYYDEYTLETINLKSEYESVYADFSQKIDGVFMYLETADGENSNFCVFNKGKLVARLTNNPTSEYNSDFFRNSVNFIDPEIAQIEPFNVDSSKMLEELFNKEFNTPYLEICRLLKVKNLENSL